jgi:hypothetical protein
LANGIERNPKPQSLIIGVVARRLWQIYHIGCCKTGQQTGR